MTQFSAAAAAPGIRLSQLSQSGIGDVADSLNLFRGDVNLPLPLISLRGRNGLDVALTALYASNVDSQVRPSNRFAPTGVLGVGWSLPRDQIVVENRLSGAAGEEAVYLVTGGAPRRLVRSEHSDDFELVDYQFWSVTHHGDELNPAQDRWEVVREDGSTYTYGGAGIEWGVRWGNWSAPGATPGGQRFPVAWNLIRVTSPQGDAITFEYEHEEVPIGSGPAYTRACYLSRITDAFGQHVTLGYEDKEPFEVEPPHPVPPGGLYAFQDRYESRFLNHVTVTSEDGAELGRVAFGYEFADVTGSDGNSHRKRYLASVTETGRTGISAPPMTFSYYAERTDPQPGAIRKITYPKGAAVSYEYQAQPLHNAATSRSVPGPGPGYVPRVWHGPGYVVVTWHSTAVGEVRVDAYTWNGTWNGWTDTKAWAVAKDSLYVQAAIGFYVAGYTDARTGEHRIRLYRQDIYQNGKWILSPYQLNLPASETPPVVRLGRDFVAVTDAAGRRLLIVSWDPVSGGWTEQEFSGLGADRLSLAVTADACVLGCYDTPAGMLRLAMHHRDRSGRWVRSDVIDEPAQIDWNLTSPASMLGAGDTFAAAAFVSRLDDEEVRYGMLLVTWDADYKFGQVVRHSGSQPLDLLNPIGVAGIADAVVGNAQHLFRFDGRSWNQEQLLQPTPGSRYGYAYGSDVAVAVVAAEGGTVSYRRASYDPYAGAWRTAAVPVADPVAALPSVSGDVLVTGREVLRRSPELRWEPLLTVPRTAAADTIANRAPSYLAWQDTVEPGTTVTTRLVTFDADGLPQPAHPLDGESFHVPDARLGQMLAGPDTCVTYHGASLDAAPSLRLHRIVDARVDTELQARAVRRARVEGGYETALVTVDYDTDTATYDPYGLVAQYVRARLYRGDPADAPGYVESVFFNGLRPDVPGVVYPDDSEFTNAREFFAKLNGQLYTQTAVDVHGRQVSRVRYDLYTYDRENSDYRCRGSFTRRRRTEAAESLHLFDADPGLTADLDARVVPAGLCEQLDGAGFPLTEPVSVTVVRRGGLWVIKGAGGLELSAVLDDGRLGIFGWITDVSESGYNARGQLSRVRGRNVDSSGQVTDQLTLTTFAWEVYPELAERHIYALAAETRTVDTSTAAIISRDVCTYRSDWPGAPGVWSWNKTYRWTGGDAAGEFDFAGWSGNSEPERDWVRTNLVLDLTSHGLARATADIGGNRGGLIYDTTGRFPVAMCALADPVADEAAWYGFEEYEDATGWQLTPPGTDPGEYITEGDAFTGRRRLAIPGDPAKRVGLSRTLRPAAAEQPFLLSCWLKTEPGFVTDPELAGWRVTVGRAEATVTAIPDTNGRWQFFHLIIQGARAGDEITVEVFSQQDHRPLLVDAIGFAPLYGRCSATVYDAVDKAPEATLELTGMVTRYGYNRARLPVLTIRDGEPADTGAEYNWRAHRDGPFDPADPNANLGLIARTTGSYADFRHGEEWTRCWDASAGWRAHDGELRYDGTAGDGTLTLRDAADRRDYATRVALASAPEPSATLGFAFGTAFTAEWADGRWQLRDHEGTVLEETAAPVFSHHDITLWVTGSSALLAAGGQVMLHHTFPAELAGPVQLRTGGPLAVSWLAVLGSPTARVCYVDNAGQTRQAQSIGDGQLLVTGWTYDYQGRADVAAKPTAAAGGPGFRPGYITGLDPATGTMGDCELTRAYPQDGGYPFTRTLFEKSPMGRVVEQGSPGRQLAIDPAVAWAARHTTRMLYGLNLADPETGLPAGQYRSIGVLDPDGVLGTNLTDRLGAVVATRAGTGEALVRSQMRYNAKGSLTEIQQPNFFDRELPEHDKNIATMEYDAAGDCVGVRTPDLDGAVRTVYDKAGRSRFQRTPQQAADGRLAYSRYDRVGRLTEQGVCVAQWDEEELRAHADELAWLPGEPHWHTRYHFDGDGDLDLLSRLWRTETSGGDSGAATTTTLRYDRHGRIQSSTLAVEGRERTVRYHYDLAGTVTALEYADDRVRVDYGSDRFGRLATVAVTGPGGHRKEVAAYTYRPDGSVATEILGPGEGQLERVYQYTSAGWLREITDRYLVESTDYFTGGYGGGGSHTGRAARVTSRFTGVDDPGFIGEHHYEYAYDGLGRLLRAVAVPNGSESIGDRMPLRYDRNGNLLVLTHGDDTQAYMYFPGRNRLRRVGDLDADNVFSADGDLTQQPDHEASTFRYDPLTGLPVRVGTRQGATLDFSYDGTGCRVLKAGPEGSLFYLPGPGGQPLLTEAAGQPSDYLIYGQNGLTAVYHEGELLHLLKGRLGSTRAIWDGSQLVAAYNYRPFGDLMSPAYRLPSAAAFPYLFTGHELDAETGLYNLGMRFYDPATVRMISTDPAGQYPSPYLYAGADPINLIDPDGAFAWSWEAFGAVVLGVLALAAGIFVTVATAGAASPAGVILGAIGGGLLIGAGVASAAYGFTRADASTSQFDWAEWGLLVGLGAGFGMISAGAGLALAPFAATLGTIGILGIETIIGGLSGMADNLFTTMALNSLANQDLMTGWQEALWTGALAGGIGGMIGGALGRGGNLRTRLAVNRGANSGNYIDVYSVVTNKKVNHIVIEGSGSSSFKTDLIKVLPGQKSQIRFYGNPRDTEIGVPARLAVHKDAFNAALQMARNSQGTEGTFAYVFKDCTTWGKDMLRAADMPPPPWAISPSMLKWWASSFSDVRVRTGPQETSYLMGDL